MKLTTQYLKNKYRCIHYLKHLQNRGYLYSNEIEFLLNIIDVEVLNERQTRQLFKTHKGILQTIRECNP